MERPQSPQDFYTLRDVLFVFVVQLVERLITDPGCEANRGFQIARLAEHGH